MGGDYQYNYLGNIYGVKLGCVSLLPVSCIVLQECIHCGIWLSQWSHSQHANGNVGLQCITASCIVHAWQFFNRKHAGSLLARSDGRPCATCMLTCSRQPFQAHCDMYLSVHKTCTQTQRCECESLSIDRYLSLSVGSNACYDGCIRI